MFEVACVDIRKLQLVKTATSGLVLYQPVPYIFQQIGDGVERESRLIV